MQAAVANDLSAFKTHPVHQTQRDCCPFQNFPQVHGDVKEGTKTAWHFSSYYHGNALYTRMSEGSQALCRALKVDRWVYEPVTFKDYRPEPLKSWEEGKDSWCKKIVGSEKIHKIPSDYNGSCSRKAIPLSSLWTFHKSIGNGRADVPVARNEGSRHLKALLPASSRINLEALAPKSFQMILQATYWGLTQVPLPLLYCLTKRPTPSWHWHSSELGLLPILQSWAEFDPLYLQLNATRWMHQFKGWWKQLRLQEATFILPPIAPN